ncbi:hypothetical protein [Streptomyces sp. NPDC058773]|uniref:hypothetical protein n=1 Tax=Streptomyces sp. NPDC058773 TaxID=3346632 RepID=UPI00368A9A88
MQVTGETLERAMAVLEGHTAQPAPQPETAEQPNAAEVSCLRISGPGPETETGGATGAEATGATDTAGESSNADTEKASDPGAPRTPRQRGHLRGL